MDVRMFSNLVQMAAGYPAEQCGMNGQCACYFVVEGDGSIYPCDFYCLDYWKLGTVKDSFQNLLISEKARQFTEESKPVSEQCKICSYFSLCRGGCRRWRETAANGTLDINYLCPAYQMFFSHAWDRINRLGMYIIKNYGRPG